jgi:hypothetical protein
MKFKNNFNIFKKLAANHFGSLADQKISKSSVIINKVSKIESNIYLCLNPIF